MTSATADVGGAWRPILLGVDLNLESCFSCHFPALVLWGLDMNVGKTLFAQIMAFVPWTSFVRIVNRYSGNAGVRTMNCAEQFRVMALAQLTQDACTRPLSIKRPA